MDNEIVKQWIVRRKVWIWSSLRLLVQLKNGDYYLCIGETGEFAYVDKEDAEKMINNSLN